MFARALLASVVLLNACATSSAPPSKASQTSAPALDPPSPATAPSDTVEELPVLVDTFADIRVLRYRVPHFEQLSLQQKQLLYYLYEAALAGRDITWDQNYRHNLAIRRTLEAVINTNAQAETDPAWPAFLTYAKRVWFSNGIHHHYASSKFLPEFEPKDFERLVRGADPNALPLVEGETVDALIAKLTPVLFDPAVDTKRVNLDPKQDLIASSATNLYGPDVKQAEVEAFYRKLVDPKDPTPISYGLNSQLAKQNGKLVERVWKVDGMYGAAIAKIVHWLEKAVTVAENEQQAAALRKLIEYYKTGDLRTFDEYSIAWVADTDSTIDVVNGFIETYGDPLGYRGTFESVVSVRDPEASRRIEALKNEAQWFEDNSPIAAEYKKENVQGISAKVINVVVESGDAHPSTPIGINLPNANWIRALHGSKSVSLGNIVDANDASVRVSGVLDEFAASPEEVARAKAHGELADKLHTDLHEVIGHASGKLEDGVSAEALKNYAATLEEARADLVALYYQYDPKLVELGVMESMEVGKAGYDKYIRNALLVQLARLEAGQNLEEAHMRNRYLVARWVLEKGAKDNVITRQTENGKTSFVINDYDGLRKLFGQLLAEVQRIKSKGDYKAGRKLVETYGVKVDRKLHDEVLRRYAALGIQPYTGYVNPRLVPVMKGDQITDVRIEYPETFVEQMLEYAKKHSFLPTYN